jgi:hypothetical protein
VKILSVPGSDPGFPVPDFLPGFIGRVLDFLGGAGEEREKKKEK